MPPGRAVPLTFRAIRLSTLSSSVILSLEAALRGPSLVGGDSYRVTLTAEDATTLVAWCREVAQVSSPRDGAVFRVAADVIEAAP